MRKWVLRAEMGQGEHGVEMEWDRWMEARKQKVLPSKWR